LTLSAVAIMYSLSLSNVTTYYLAAGDEAAFPVVQALAAAMQLSPVPAGAAFDVSRLVTVYLREPDNPQRGTACMLPAPRAPEDAAFVYYFHAALALAWRIQQAGGLLLHAALAAYQPADQRPQGVLFAAPGGTGKSTTSRRLPAPWRSLSDDATLLVPDGAGGFRAHPWPTWSRFLAEPGLSASWLVSESIPVRACIFLKQAPEDALEPLGAGQAASLLAESARQINFWDRDIPAAERSAFRLQRFDTVCALAKAVPAHLLHISLDGQFWRELEKTLV
jgi:SynChlorMet cassette protein ScmC